MAETKLTRAQAKEQTRQALAQATRELISERGWHEATIEAIAERVGVSSRTFFRHFPTKEAALFVRAEEMAEMLGAALDARPADEALMDSMQECLTTAAGVLQSEGWLLNVARTAEEIPAVHDYIELRVSQMIRDTFEVWARRRLGVPPLADSRPGVIAGIAAGCADTARRRWVATHGTADLPALMVESLDAVRSTVTQ